MNYFSHAAVAAGMADSNPGFVLGSMLPDLARLGEFGSSTPSDPEVRRGVDFHVRTDALFHDDPNFLRWHRAALGRLRANGVSTGPLRASAHIGVEMLLDDALARNEESVAAYEASLRFGSDNARSLFGDVGVEFAGLCALLLERARSQHPSEERLALRLGHALGRRPRLRASESELRVIARELHSLRAEVDPEATPLLNGLRSALRSSARSSRENADERIADAARF